MNTITQSLLTTVKALFVAQNIDEKSEMYNSLEAIPDIDFNTDEGKNIAKIENDLKELRIRRLNAAKTNKSAETVKTKNIKNKENLEKGQRTR